jgi:hypothetical protein
MPSTLAVLGPNKQAKNVRYRRLSYFVNQPGYFNKLGWSTASRKGLGVLSHLQNREKNPEAHWLGKNWRRTEIVVNAETTAWEFHTGILREPTTICFGWRVRLKSDHVISAKHFPEMDFETRAMQLPRPAPSHTNPTSTAILPCASLPFNHLIAQAILSQHDHLLDPGKNALPLYPPFRAPFKMADCRFTNA